MEDLDYRAALGRVVARCPSAIRDPIVGSLRCGDVTDDEQFLGAVTELLLRPDLTIAVAGYFRPVLPHLLDSLVQRLRELWSKCKCSLVDGNVGVESPSASWNFTERLCTADWNLSIHEYAVVAFSRILELAPYARSFILEYFSFAPPPFKRLLGAGATKFIGASSGKVLLLGVVRACYRFLLLEPTVFRGLWDWSSFLDLLQWKESLKEEESLSQLCSDVRWCSVQVLSLVLGMSDAAAHTLCLTVSSLTEEVSSSCLMRWKTFSQEIAIEEGLFIDQSVSSENEVTMLKKTESKFLEDYLGEVTLTTRTTTTGGGGGGVERPVQKKPSLTSLPSKPILLEGSLGAEKSSIIQELANLIGNSDTWCASLGLKLLHLLLVNIPAANGTVEHLQALAFVIPTVAKRFSVHQDAVKFEALSLLYFLLVTNRLVPIRVIFGDLKQNTSWPSDVRNGIGHILNSRV